MAELCRVLTGRALHRSSAKQSASVSRVAAKFVLDCKQPVVFRNALRTAERARLDLAGAGAHGEVSNERIFSFPRAVRYDRAVARPLRECDRFEGLGYGADLVELYQNPIRNAVPDALGEDLRIGDKLSSPTSWSLLPSAFVSAFQPGRSSSPMPSSSETMGYFFAQSL
jgi:hypothetical protein